MNILIIGGGELATMIAGQMIIEKHSVTIIEKSEELAKILNEQLDAMVITGSGINTNILSKTNPEKNDLFLALTNDDNVNIVSCGLIKKLSHYRSYTIAKIENAGRYFSHPIIEHKDFGIDNLIAPKKLSIEKLSRFIDEPNTIENISFQENNLKIIGMNITEEFTDLGKSISQIASKDDIWKKFRLIAINVDGKILIPGGDDVLKKGDKIFIIGNPGTLKEMSKKYFPVKKKIKKVTIIGGNKLGRDLAESQSKEGKTVTIIEEKESVCKKLSEEFENVLILHGSGTNQSVLDEIDMKDSFVLCLTETDEKNIISAVMAKRNGAYKVICNIRNIAITPIINELRDIDYVFSTESLALSEILNYFRKGDILSVYPIPDLKAETMKIKITNDIPILDIPLKDLKFPKGVIVGTIVRNGRTIIPHGNDDIRKNDLVILFLLPSAAKQVETMFSQNSF